jgi:uncharacterized protein YjbJ (UPF0337 family)
MAGTSVATRRGVFNQVERLECVHHFPSGIPYRAFSDFVSRIAFLAFAGEQPSSEACVCNGNKRRLGADNWRHAMNWEQVEGKWDQFKGSVKEKWGKLTDDDLTMVRGRRDNLVGRLKERYGLEKEAAEKEVDAWMSGLQ